MGKMASGSAPVIVLVIVLLTSMCHLSGFCAPGGDHGSADQGATQV